MTIDELEALVKLARKGETCSREALAALCNPFEGVDALAATYGLTLAPGDRARQAQVFRWAPDPVEPLIAFVLERAKARRAAARNARKVPRVVIWSEHDTPLDALVWGCDSLADHVVIKGWGRLKDRAKVQRIVRELASKRAQKLFWRLDPSAIECDYRGLHGQRGRFVLRIV
jgi:hypothetical protein